MNSIFFKIMVNGYFLNTPIEFSQNKLMNHFKNFLINFYNFYYRTGE